jgi:glycosyltransferase involved in cell wall biosynthesis
MLITFVSAIRDEQGGIDTFIRSFYSKIVKNPDLRQSKIQLVLVEDGSRDKTIQKILDSSNIDDLLLIKLNFSPGQAKALGIGCYLVRHSDIIVMLDADLSHPFETSLSMIQKVLIGDEIAQGVRLDFDRSQFRNLAARAFGKYLELCFRIPYRFQNTYFRAINGGALMKLTASRPSFWSYLRLNSRELRRARSSFVEFVAPARFSDKSKYPFIRLVRFGLKGIVTTSRPGLISLNILFLLLILAAITGNASLAISSFALSISLGIWVTFYQKKRMGFSIDDVQFIHVGKNVSINPNFEGNPV